MPVLPAVESPLPAARVGGRSCREDGLPGSPDDDDDEAGKSGAFLPPRARLLLPTPSQNLPVGDAVVAFASRWKVVLAAELVTEVDMTG